MYVIVEAASSSGGSGVTSVNGKTGAVVISATDITTGTFAAAQLGAGSGNNDVLTTNGSGAPTWVATLSAAQMGSGAGNNLVLLLTVQVLQHGYRLCRPLTYLSPLRRRWVWRKPAPACQLRAVCSR